MSAHETAAVVILAIGTSLSVLARSFAAFSRFRLESLVDKSRERNGEEGETPGGGPNRQERAHYERELAQTASVGRNVFGLAYAFLAALIAFEGPGFRWDLVAMWAAGWIVSVEIVARVIGTSFAEQIVHWLGTPARYLLFPLRPFGKLVFVGATAVDRLRGQIEPQDEHEEIEEEIRAIIAGGVLKEEEGEMIESVLNLRDVDVGEIMTPRTEMVSIPSSASLDEAIKIAAEAGHSRVPVFEQNRDNIIGIFYVKDLLRHWGKEPPPPLGEIIREPHFIPETRKVSGLLEELKKANVHIAVVLDEYGGTSGLVTVEDIVEEIVGEITDEYDSREEPTWRWTGQGTLEADARVHVDEVAEAFDEEFPPSEDYDTVGGLVAALMGHIPRKGEVVRHEELEFEISDADARRVKTVLVRRANGRS